MKKTENETIRILVVEDNEEVCSRTEEYIRQIPDRKFQIDCIYDYDDALARMKDGAYDIYFIDYKLDGKNGMDLLKEAMEVGCEAPVILISTQGNKEMDLKAMEMGAYDYISRSELNTENLERCIRYSLERASTLQALKASERKYRNIYEKARDIVFISSEDHKFIDINYAVTELLEYEQDELLLMDISILFLNKNDYNLLNKILDEFGEFSGYQADLVTKTGEVKNCIISASYETNDEGVTYLQGIIHDNTTRKRVEKSVLQSEKLAATSRLVRTLAHEVRNPLNNINLSINQLTQHVGDDEDAKMYLEIVQRNGKRIGDLITELLDASRLDSQLNFIRSSLQNVLDKALEAALDRISLNNIRLQVSYPKDQFYIVMDEEKLKLAFLNIIINAIEAMDDGKGKLTISIKSVKNEYFVLIKDNGCGISEENIQKLYEPYFTSKRNGMGLGLANTINIIQSHNAQIDVESAVGVGTTFIISFHKSK